MKKLGFLAFAAVSGSALGVGFDISGGTGGAIPDSALGNAPADSSLTVTLNVSGNDGAIIDVLSLAGFNGAHTWIGDLLVTVEHLGVTVELMDRNYRTVTTSSGSSTDLDGEYMFDEGAVEMTGTLAAPGTYGRNSNAAAGVGAFTQTYADFAGLALDGDWNFTFLDHWVGDTGGVELVRIVGEATVVPEPATMAALGFGALALIRRRRK